MIRICSEIVECDKIAEMEKVRLSPCGVQIGDSINSEVTGKIEIYSCPTLKLEPETQYSVDSKGKVAETFYFRVKDFKYQDCWQMRDGGNCIALQG